VVLSEKERKMAKKVPLVLFVKHKILEDLTRKNHVTLYTTLPFCTVLLRAPLSIMSQYGDVEERLVTFLLPKVII
jgi:hypothetical protein